MATTITTAGELLRLLTAQGYQDGPPAQVKPETLRIDLAAAKRVKCPRCKARGLTPRPLHRGQRYKVLSVCGACDQAVEL